MTNLSPNRQVPTSYLNTSSRSPLHSCGHALIRSSLTLRRSGLSGPASGHSAATAPHPHGHTTTPKSANRLPVPVPGSLALSAPAPTLLLLLLLWPPGSCWTGSHARCPDLLRLPLRPPSPTRLSASASRPPSSASSGLWPPATGARRHRGLRWLSAPAWPQVSSIDWGNGGID